MCHPVTADGAEADTVRASNPGCRKRGNCDGDGEYESVPVLKERTKPKVERRKTLMGCVGPVNDSAAINRAMLTLIPFFLQLLGRLWDRCPSFDDPPRVVGVRGVFAAGDFAVDRPIETEGG